MDGGVEGNEVVCDSPTNPTNLDAPISFGCLVGRLKAGGALIPISVDTLKVGRGPPR